MIGQFISVTPDELQAYLQNSSLLEERLDAALENDDPAFFDIHKSWDALSYLITGVPLHDIDKAVPLLSWVIFGDEVIDENLDFGYGPARYLSNDQVKEVNAVLMDMSAEDLNKHFDPDKMTELEIYPGDWNEGEKQWLDRAFHQLKAFYKTSAENNQAVISYIS